MGPDGGQRLVEGHQPPCFSDHLSHCHSSAVTSLGCWHSQCWAATVDVAGILVLPSSGHLVPAVVGPGHLEGCLVLGYITQALSMKCHIETLGLWLHFLFLGLRTLLASRGQEKRNLGN